MSPEGDTGTVGKRDQNRIDQRARILDTARVLFAERGFDDVTVAQIATHVGVARATVFNYFSSKHALVDGITAEVYEYYVGMLDRALADEESSTPLLIRALFEQMAGIESLQRFYKGVFREIARLRAGLEEGGSAMLVRDQMIARLTRLLERGQARGEISLDHDATDLALAFDLLAHGTIGHWLVDDPSKSLIDRMRRGAEIFLGPVALGRRPADRESLPDLSPPDLQLQRRSGA